MSIIKNSRKVLLVFISIFFFAVANIDAQTSYKIQLNDFKSDSLSKQIVARDDGGFVLGEIFPGQNAITFNLVITRLSKSVQILWSKTISIHGTDSDIIFQLTPRIRQFDIENTNDNGILVAYGYKYLTDDCILTKLDSNGNIQWADKISPRFKGAFLTSTCCAAIKNDGFVISGAYDSAAVDDTIGLNLLYKQYRTIYFIARIDNNGRIRWINAQQFALYYPSFLQKVSVFSDRSFLITDEGMLIKTDTAGNIQWSKFTGESYGASGVVLDASDNIYASSYWQKPTGNGFAYAPVLTKFDKNGNFKWAYHYGSTLKDSENYYTNLILSPGNKLIIYGYQGSNTDSIRIEQIDTSGKYIQCNILPVHNPTYASWFGWDNISASTGGIFFSGASKSHNTIILKTDSSLDYLCGGRQISLNTYNYGIKPDTSPISLMTRGGFVGSDTTIRISSSKIMAPTIVCTNIFIPQASLGNDTVLCTASSFLLYKGLKNYGCQTLWSTGDTTDSIVIAKSGTYWLRISHGPYITTDSIKIIFESQIKTGLPKKQFICSYDSILLKVQDTTIPNYYWITPKKTIVNGYKIIAKDSGNYYLMLSGTQSCAALDTVHIGYYPLPLGTAGPDTILCYDQAYTMQGAGGIKYQWIPATFLSSATDPHALATLPNTEQYILVVSNTQGCHDTSRVLLKVHPKLQVKASANNTEVCYGQTVVLKASAHGGDSLHYQFSWINDHITGDSVSANQYQSGWHPVVLSDNCSAANATDSVFVNVIPQAKAAFIYVPASKIKSNHNVNFDNRSMNASSYLWTFGTIDSSKMTSPVYIYTDTGEYRVMLVAYGLSHCPNDTAYSFIKIITDQITIYIPNSFTPNGDGVNDFFDISGVGIASYSYHIYNRWGEHIFSFSSQFPPLGGQGAARPGGAGGAWDGTFRGVPVQPGVYLYQMDVLDIEGYHHYLSGNITVIR